MLLVSHARTMHFASGTSLLNEAVSITLSIHHTNISQDIIRRKIYLDALDFRGEHLAGHRRLQPPTNRLLAEALLHHLVKC